MNYSAWQGGLTIPLEKSKQIHTHFSAKKKKFTYALTIPWKNLNRYAHTSLQKKNRYAHTLTGTL